MLCASRLPLNQRRHRDGLSLRLRLHHKAAGAVGVMPYGGISMTNQSWKAEEYSSHASFVSELGSPVVELLNPQPGETILDLGCGDGTLASKMDEDGAVVIGIDSSDSMVRSAQSKGIQAYVQSGEKLSFANKFDAVFSNAALHWMRDYNSVLEGVYKALKSSGRFVGEFGGKGNIAYLREAMREVYQAERFGTYSDPWFFPSPEQYASALSSAEFSVEYIELIPRPTPLTTGVVEWLRIFADHLLGELSPDEAQRFLVKVEEKVRPQLYSSSQGWVADYVRIRFAAQKA